MFILKKLNEVRGKEKYHVEVPNSFASSEDLDLEVEINSTSARIRKGMKISAEESKFLGTEES
jgi:hypothetical protein